MSSALPLSQYEGKFLLSAAEAMLKGALEAELEVSIIAGSPHGAFAPLIGYQAGAEHAAVEAVNQLLRQHHLRLMASPDASRAIMMAYHAARAGRAGFALVLNDQLDHVIPALTQILSEPLERGAMCVVLEDSPRAQPASCPRRAAQRLNMPCVEPSNLRQLRDGMEHALRLSRAGRTAAAMVVHASILRSCDTLEMRPNRVMSSVDALLARRKRPRSLRGSEGGGAAGPLRAARRLELNRFRAIPNPGERVPVGFITVGPADEAMLHITNTLGLHGRVPVLQMGLVHPVDESAVDRMLTRCQRVIVLEPRPGSVETGVLFAAEAMRRRGEEPATVWGREIPSPESEERPAVALAGGGAGGDELHPSLLVRRILPLLHAIRPTMQVASHLLPAYPALDIAVPPRGSQVGVSAALNEVKRILRDVDQWLRDRAPLEERGLEPRALAIDGAEVPGFSGDIVNVETWTHRRFQQAGISALVHAAQEKRPWIFVACESSSEEIRDLERLARGAIPAAYADRVSLQTANLADLVGLRETLREAAMSERMTVLIVRDGPPPQFDVAAIEQSLVEIDRLGFEPRQRLVRRADEVCAIRSGTEDETEPHLLESDVSTLKTEFSVDELSGRAATKFMVRVRPLLEEVEVIRTRPPAASQDLRVHGGGGRLPVPQPLHAKQAQWRVHVAGFRREAPGVAAMALCHAGRAMGYHVRCVHDSTPISTGRRAWSQVLFTSVREGEEQPPVSAAIPYGEADLLLGWDAQETLRAIGPDAALRIAFANRTCAVVNTGDLAEVMRGREAPISPQRFAEALLQVTQGEQRILEDFASVCRAWFHTDRVADMAMLGAAYQRGFIPVSPEAMDAAVQAAEQRGAGRSREAFELGRRLAHDPGLFARPEHQEHEAVSRLARRISLTLSRGAWGRGQRVRNFSALLHQSLDSMPGLAETDAGREARRDFVVACYRCRVWGGLDYAQQYAMLITRLYRSDRGDRGRALTRAAILPLADVMLIRDPLFIANMASSAEQRRHTRQRLNVRAARGDRIERRYLTRLELIAFNRRFRADVRTSDWPARAVGLLRGAAPIRWRGTKRERDLRQYVIDFIRSAAENAERDYDRWLEPMQRLHSQAAEDRLRGMAMAEVKMLIGTSVAGAGGGELRQVETSNGENAVQRAGAEVASKE